jgi:ribosomal protein S8
VRQRLERAPSTPGGDAAHLLTAPVDRLTPHPLTADKKLYEKVFQVRSAEIHYLLKRLPNVAQAFGVVLFGTSEGAMTVLPKVAQAFGVVLFGTSEGAMTVSIASTTRGTVR